MPSKPGATTLDPSAMRLSRVRPAAGSLFGLLLAAGSVAAQSDPPAPLRRLSRPDAVLAEAFSSVRGVRELSSGAVLVADWIEERVVLADLEAGSVGDRLTPGQGPGEVRLPAGLIPMPGDSTLLVDLGNSRLTVLGPDGRAARSIRADRAGMTGVRGVDPDGALYFAVPAWAEAGRALPADSVRLVRLDPRSGTSRVVAVIQGSRFRSDARAPSYEPRIPIGGYASQDAWVLSSAGDVAVVRGGDYHLDLVRRDGTSRSGPSYATPRPAVTDADRRRFILDFSASSPTSGRGPDGGMGHTPPPDEPEVARLLRTTEFAATHPQFTGSPVAAPHGRVWVGRSLSSRAPSVYDVFDPDGRRSVTVELPAGRSVVAVGERGVYAVVESELGLQSLERYPPPG